MLISPFKPNPRTYLHLHHILPKNNSLFKISQQTPSTFRPNLSTVVNFSVMSNDVISTESVTPNTDENDTVKFGFERPEMYTEKLTGSVNPYGRHVFLCYKTHNDWPARIESSDADLIVKRLAGAIKDRKNDISVKSLLTVCEGGDGTGLTDGDVLVFPDLVKYSGLEESNIDSFVEDVLVNGKPWASGTEEKVAASYVFVCAHNSRDKRCGVCGPPLIEKFNEEIGVRGLTDQVFVSACSHVGGHKYAGNLIIYSAAQDEKVSGHWYGYVTPNDVTELLDRHIKKGEIIERIWRGQMGVPPVEKAEKAVEPTLPNGSDLKEIVKEEKENTGGCCQGVNGVSCCRDESSEAKTEGKKSTYELDIFSKKWEQHEIFTAAALVGAVATVAVAYSLYKRSR